MQFVNFPPRKIGTKIEIQAGLPEPVPVSNRWHEAAREIAPMLGQNAAEASRLTIAGRRTELLREAKTFDETKLETMPLFQNAGRQGKLL